MRRLLLPALLSLTFALPPAVSAAEVPQWTNSFGMTFSLIPAGTCWTGGPAPRFLTYESPACLRGVLGPLARVQREGGACEGRSR